MATFGEMISGGGRLRGSDIEPETAAPVAPPSPAGGLRKRSTLLPFGVDEAGKVVPAMPQILVDAFQAASYPGQVWRGEKEVFDRQTGHVSEEAMNAANGIAGTAMTGSLPFSAPKGALRSFGGAAAKDDPLAALEAGLGAAMKDMQPYVTPRSFADPGAKNWDLYHGTAAPVDFGRFRTDLPSEARPHTNGSQVQSQAVFLSPSPDEAAHYALSGGKTGEGAAAGPRTMRVTVDPGKTGVLDMVELAQQPGFVDRIYATQVAEKGNPTDPDVLRSIRYGVEQLHRSTLDKIAAAKAFNEQYGHLGVSETPTYNYLGGGTDIALQMARERGLDTAIIRGLSESNGGDQVVALTPDRVRSFYDPSQVLYSGGPTGAGVGAVAVAGLGSDAQSAPSSPPSTPSRKPGAKMAGLFDHLLPASDASEGAGAPMPAPAPTPPPVSAKPGLFDHLLTAAPPQKSGLSQAGAVAADMAQSAGAGIIRGAASVIDAPQNIYGWFDDKLGGLARGAVRTFGGTPNSDLGIDTRARGAIPSPADLPRPGESALKGLEAATGPLYEPQTTAGQYARTVGEFIPGAGKKLGSVVAYGIVPGLASETAGQATKGTAAEPYARAGAAVAAFRSPANVERTIAQRTEGVTAAQVDAAEALFQDAASRGLPLTRANALDAVTNGATSLSDAQRILEGNGRLRSFFAPTADAVEREGRTALGTVAPAGASPTALGGAVQEAAQAGVAQTPQGMALAQARDAAGPRVSPDQAGAVIQPELRRVYEGREGMRAALGEQDYAAARNAPENVGIERTIEVERPGEPIVTQPRFSRPQFEAGAPRPAEAFERPGAIAAEPGPKSLARFIAENGGLRLDGDAAATDLHRFMVPGVGKVARPDGKSLDSFWRERLIEEGYFRPDADGGMARDISSELLRKLQNEQRGVPSYPLDSAGRPKGRAASGQAADDYANARSLAESRFDEDIARVEIDPKSIHPDIRERVVGALMRGEETDPLAAYERTVGAMKGPLDPYVKSTTVRETIPDVRFGQANPGDVVTHIDEALRSAKGPVAKALQQARETLFTNPVAGQARELDLSVGGLHGAREAINDLISKAEPTAQRALMGVRERLDRSLSVVPEYEHARSGFEAASRNLDPFAPGTAPGRIVDQEQVSGRLTMPRERAPAAITEGPTAARDFNAVAPPEARRAVEGRLTTEILDGIKGEPGAKSAEAIRDALRQQEDVVGQFPAVRERLEEIARAHDGLDVVMRSPVGKLSKHPDVKNAINALFPTNPLPGSAPEVGEAMRRVAAYSPRTAQELVRMHMESVFNEATQRLQSGANQAGGAKFSAVLAGNREQAASLEAAMKALPGGEKTWTGMRRFLDILDAQGARQAIGSGTSFNNVFMADMKAGKPINEAGAAIATGGVKLPQKIMDRIEGWRMGRGLDEMAALFTDPKMAGTFQRIATQPQGSAGLYRLATMALSRGMRGYHSADEPKPAPQPKREPLKFSGAPKP